MRPALPRPAPPRPDPGSRLVGTIDCGNASAIEGSRSAARCGAARRPVWWVSYVACTPLFSARREGEGAWMTDAPVVARE